MNESKSKVKVLDHGYVEFIEAWGHGKDGEDNTVYSEHGDHFIHYDVDYEVGIVEAARQSTQGSFRGWEEGQCTCSAKPLNDPEQKLGFLLSKVKHDKSCSYHPGDAKLLKHLYEHKHFTPFEFSGMVIEVQAPIFVFREWHRHRTQSYNEMSARYAPLPDLYYTPDFDRVMLGAEATANKQAQGTGRPLTPSNASLFLERLENFYHIAEAHYQNALADGVPKELARVVMPVGHYSRMRASANLRNWLAFVTLRCDPQAQWEIRQFANVVADLISQKFPRTYQLWSEEFFE